MTELAVQPPPTRRVTSELLNEISRAHHGEATSPRPQDELVGSEKSRSARRAGGGDRRRLRRPLPPNDGTVLARRVSRSRRMPACSLRSSSAARHRSGREGDDMGRERGRGMRGVEGTAGYEHIRSSYRMTIHSTATLAPEAPHGIPVSPYAAADEKAVPHRAASRSRPLGAPGQPFDEWLTGCRDASTTRASGSSPGTATRSPVSRSAGSHTATTVMAIARCSRSCPRRAARPRARLAAALCSSRLARRGMTRASLGVDGVRT